MLVIDVISVIKTVNNNVLLVDMAGSHPLIMQYLLQQQGLIKQSSLEDPFENGNDDDITRELENLGGSDDELPPTPPRPSTPAPAKGLPWTPKVR